MDPGASGDFALWRDQFRTAAVERRDYARVVFQPLCAAAIQETRAVGRLTAGYVAHEGGLKKYGQRHGCGRRVGYQRERSQRADGYARSEERRVGKECR